MMRFVTKSMPLPSNTHLWSLTINPNSDVKNGPFSRPVPQCNSLESEISGLYSVTSTVFVDPVANESRLEE